jgi:hypothetical protein
MSQSSLQLLLHAGELEYIVNTIKASKSTDFVGGCLFGLWRNSLIQPVIQFVTGTGRRATSIKDLFENRYTEIYAGVVEKDHRLSHLGFWFFGSKDEQDRGTCKCIYVIILLFTLCSRSDRPARPSCYSLQPS